MKKLFILIGLLITIIVQSQTVTYPGTRIFTGELRIATEGQFNFKGNYITSIQTGDTIATIEAMRILLSNYLEQGDTAELIATQYGLSAKINYTDTVSLVGTKYDLTQKLGINATAANSNLLQGKDSAYIKANWFVETDPVWISDSTTYISKSQARSDIHDSIAALTIGEPLYEGDSSYLKSNVRELLTRTDTTSELVSRTIYVSMPTDPQTPGSDVTGDGSALLPFATINKALKTMKSVIRAQIYIQLDSGTFDLTIADYRESERFVCNPYVTKGGSYVNDLPFIIQGQIVQELAVTLTKDADTTFLINASGTSWVADQYEGYFTKHTNTYYPIESNTSNRLYSSVPISGSISNDIFRLNTTLNCAMYNYGTINNFMVNFQKANFYSILYRYLKITDNVTTVQAVYVGNSFPLNILFTTCSFIRANNVAFFSSAAAGAQAKRFNFTGCFFKNTYSSTALSMFNDVGMGMYVFLGCVLKGNNNNFFNFSPNVFFSMNYNIISTSNSFMTAGVLRLQGRLLFKNITNVFYSNANYPIEYIEPTNSVYENVTNLIYKTRTETEYNIVINATKGWTNIFNSSSLCKNVYNDLLNTKISIPGTYPEYQQKQSVTLADNSTDSISIGNMSYNRTIDIDYYIVRSGVYRKGSFKILNDGTNILFAPDSYFPSTDIGFTINGAYKSGGSNTIKLKWTTTSTGAAATITYDTRRQNF